MFIELKSFLLSILTTEADASLLPPYSMPANIPITVAVPQLTVPASFAAPWKRENKEVSLQMHEKY